MKVLIIKNDGFGDVIVSLPLLTSIYHKKYENLELDIVLSKVNSDLKFYLKNFKNIYFLESLGSKFNPKKKISEIDKKILKKIKKKKYDICFVMRRNLNYENLMIMQAVNAKQKYTCTENFLKNKNLINLLDKTTPHWININQDGNKINEYSFFENIINKIGFKIRIKKNKTIIHKYDKKKEIIINLSGEKQFTIPSNFSKIIDLVLNMSNSKIIIIGRTFDKKLAININTILRKYKNNKRISNLFMKTNFFQSMNLINKSSIYVGFETGLSHYAVNKAIKSLILLAAGGGHKWFPYPKEIRKNETYWTYHTPCADCDYIGENQCIFKTRFCIDNIFTKDLKKNFISFLNTKNDLVNFSSYSYFLSNWRYKSKRTNIYKLSKNKKIQIKNDIISKTKYLSEIFKFVLLNKLTFFLFKKMIFKIF